MHYLTRAGVALLGISSAAAAQWNQTQPPTYVCPVTHAAMAYDATRSETVLFGGFSRTGTHSETWTYNGTSWIQKSPLNSPWMRGGSGMVFDSSRGVTVLYGGMTIGGRGFNPVGEHWEWDGTDWNRVFTPTSPGRRGRQGMAFDSARGRVVMYGGLSRLSDTWEYDGNNWAQVITAQSPGPREAAAMCYHAGLGAVVLFGGLDGLRSATGDTWTFDGTDWTQLTLAGATPPARLDSQMVYDPTRDVCILFGGSGASGILDDTWEFDGHGWAQTSSGTPTARYAHVMAMDTGRDQVVLFGGTDSIGTEFTDTWEYRNDASYRAFGAGCLGTNGVPDLSNSSLPRLGSPLRLSLSNLNVTASIAAVVFGRSNTVARFGPLPFDLSVIGATGCSMHVSLDLVAGVPAAGGTANLTVPVPNVGTILGATIYTQGLSLDPGGNPLGLVVSNAGTAVVGY